MLNIDFATLHFVFIKKLYKAIKVFPNLVYHW